MRRAVLDSNVWISAFQFGGKPAHVVDMAMDGDLQIAVSWPIIAETRRILREKLGWDTERLEFAVAQMLSCARLITPDQQLDVVPGDKNDNIIIECAVAAGAEAIVTGDKDLLRMKAYSGIRMVTVADLLQQQQFPK